MSWQNVVMDAPGADAPRLTALLEALGAESVSLLDAGDESLLEPAPGTAPLWEAVRLVGLFPAAADVPALLSRADALWRRERGEGLPPWRLEPLAERDWTEAWRQHARPIELGERLRVLPADEPGGAFAGATVRLVPGLAFGTGGHPTTRLCLEWLAAHPPEGRRVTDFGCGSGILALAALALGARSVRAVDSDAQAIRATRANAERNPGGERLEVTAACELAPDDADLVLANVLAGPLEERADALAAHLRAGGDLVLAGVLEDQVDSVCAAYPGFRFEVTVSEGWARLHGRRGGSPP